MGKIGRFDLISKDCSITGQRYRCTVSGAVRGGQNCLSSAALGEYLRSMAEAYSMLITGQARLLFAIGSAAVTSMLSAVLSILSTKASSASTPMPSGTIERQPLLASTASSSGSTADTKSSTRIAGLLGFSTGLGALLAVFLFLRFPTTLFRSLPSAQALQWTFRSVALIALLNAALAYFGLPRTDSASRQSRKGSLLREVKSLGNGFALAKRDSQVSLGYFAGFVARAQNIAIA